MLAQILQTYSYMQFRIWNLLFILALSVLSVHTYAAKKKIVTNCEQVHFSKDAEIAFNFLKIPEIEIADIPWNNHSYQQGRNLRQDGTQRQSYEGMLDQKFIQKVTRLSSDKVVVDVGAASFSALAELAVEYIGKGKKPPKLIGIAPEKSQGSHRNVEILKQLGPDRFAIIAKYVESVKEIPPNSVDQIIDVHAAGSYSRAIDSVFMKYLNWLKVDGRLDMRYGSDSTVIKTKAGKFITVTEWLKSIPGIEVVEIKPKYLKIIKKQPNVTIPKLTLTSYTLGEPPNRIFEVAE